MPSVASESAAVLSSRSSLPSIRNYADASRNEPGTSFSDLLDNTASAADQPPPSPPQARTDRGDAAKPADDGASSSKPAQDSASGQSDASSKADETTAAASADGTAETKAAKDGTAGKPDKAAIVKLATDIDTNAKTDAKAPADASDKTQAASDPTAAVTATPTPVVAVPPAQIPTVAPVAAASANADDAEADPLAALEAAAAGQGQRAGGPAKAAGTDNAKSGNADGAKPASTDATSTDTTKAANTATPALTGAAEHDMADAKAATDARTAAQVEAAKDGQPRGDADKPAINVHRAAADLLAKADAPSAQAGSDPAASVKAGTDAAQAIGAAPQTAATTANAAGNTATAITTAQAQVQAAAVPLSGVAFEISNQAGAGKSHFEIRLDPPELGRIDVKLDVDRDGNVSTRLVVDRSETLDLLKRDAPALERALQQAGLKTSDHGLDFSLRQQNSQQNDNPQSNTNRIVIPDDEPAPLEASRQNYGRLLGTGSGLDIRV